jgi:hypothetical protein
VALRKKLVVSLPTRLSKAYEDSPIEGIGLAMLQYGNRTFQDLFSIPFEALLGCDVFTPTMAPFVIRSRGPTWFKKEFPATLVEDEAETNVI